MEVALTCPARPVLDHPHIDPSGTTSGTATKFRTLEAGERGARCQVSNARAIISTRRSPHVALGTARSERTTFQPGMCMKRKNEVSGARCEVRAGSSRFTGSRRQTREGAERKNHVPSRNVYENKRPVRSPGSRVRRPNQAPCGNKGRHAAKFRRSKPECL